MNRVYCHDVVAEDVAILYLQDLQSTPETITSKQEINTLAAEQQVNTLTTEQTVTTVEVKA